MTRTEYHAYLASREWAVKREAVRQRSGNRCERWFNGHRCVGEHENTHHLTYIRIGNELLEDLLGVCEDCHAWLSGKCTDDPLVKEVNDFLAYKKAQQEELDRRKASGELTLQSFLEGWQ